MIFVKFFLFSLPDQRIFVPPWLCEMLSSGPPHPAIALYLYILSPSSSCGLSPGHGFYPTSPHCVWSYSLTHQLLLCQWEMYFPSLTPLSSQAHLSTCLADISWLGISSSNQTQYSCNGPFDLSSLPSLSIIAEQTSTIPVAQACNLSSSPILHTFTLLVIPPDRRSASASQCNFTISNGIIPVYKRWVSDLVPLKANILYLTSRNPQQVPQHLLYSLLWSLVLRSLNSHNLFNTQHHLEFLPGP